MADENTEDKKESSDAKAMEDKDTPQKGENTIAEAAPAESAKEAAEVLSEAPEAVEKAPVTASESKAVSEIASEQTPRNDEKKESKPVSKDLEKIIESIEKLSVLELADLVHALEDRFGVTATPVMAAGAAASAVGSGEPQEEQTTFNVILASAGANKIGVIKSVRELVPTLGLKEAKDLVEAAPKPVMEGVNKERANEAKTKLTAAGATVELQ